MEKPVTNRVLTHFWKKVKQYIDEYTYPRRDLPDLFFDAETSSLYVGQKNVGYDFQVIEGKLYYKDKGGTK